MEKSLLSQVDGIGKLATVLFYVAIAASLTIRYLNTNVLQNPIHDFSIYIYCIALIATIAALIMYFKAFNLQKYIKDEKDKLN